MIERYQRITRFIEGLDRETFMADEKTSDSVVRNLEAIGEAAYRLPAAFKERIAEVPWHRVAGLRHRIVHDCFDVDLDQRISYAPPLPRHRLRSRPIPADDPAHVAIPVRVRAQGEGHASIQ